MEQIRVLVVDDELFVGELLKEYLSIIGYEVTAVSNGEDALSVIQQSAASHRYPGYPDAGNGRHGSAEKYQGEKQNHRRDHAVCLWRSGNRQ